MTFNVRYKGSVQAAAAVVLFVAGCAVHASAQQEPPGRGQEPPAGRGQAPAPGRGRGTPPQPQQKQGVEYFLGSWTFTATGRESALSVGPRQGTTTFTRKGTANVLEFQTAGKSDDTGAPYKETGTAEWDDAKKIMTFRETVLNGVQVSGRGDWTSPLSIRYESQVVKAGGESIQLRRTYSILAAHAFSVAEEISTNGGPFQRMGTAVFRKVIE